MFLLINLFIKCFKSKVNFRFFLIIYDGESLELPTPI